MSLLHDDHEKMRLLHDSGGEQSYTDLPIDKPQQYSDGKEETIPLQSLFEPPPTSASNEQEEENAMSNIDDNRHQDQSLFVSQFMSKITAESITSTFIGGTIFVLFHIVFSLAQASAIPRPFSSRPCLGPMVSVLVICRPYTLSVSLRVLTMLF